MRQVVGLDFRVDGWIGRDEADSASGLRPVDDRVDGEALPEGVPTEVLLEELLKSQFNNTADV